MSNINLNDAVKELASSIAATNFQDLATIALGTHCMVGLSLLESFETTQDQRYLFAARSYFESLESFISAIRYFNALSISQIDIDQTVQWAETCKRFIGRAVDQSLAKHG